MHPYDDEFDMLDDVTRKEGLPIGAIDNTETMAEVEPHEGGDRKQNSQLNMHDLSMILHPSHESSTPDPNQNQSPAPKDGGEAGLCRQACDELGVSQSQMNQMYLISYP